MKKALILALALTLLAVGLGIAGVTSSKHDLGVNGPTASAAILGNQGTTSQVCVYCHHPHGNRGGDQDLLWNVNSSAAGPYATYNGSATTTANVTGAAIDKAQSTLCMSCHDGTAGEISFYKAAADGTLGDFTWETDALADLGGDLKDDHPMGFIYPVTGETNVGDLAIPSADTSFGTSYSVAATYPLYGDTVDTATMECSTCHAVHNGGSPKIQFMRGDTTDLITGSAICKDCHTTK